MGRTAAFGDIEGQMQTAASTTAVSHSILELKTRTPDELLDFRETLPHAGEFISRNAVSFHPQMY